MKNEVKLWWNYNSNSNYPSGVEWITIKTTYYRCWRHYFYKGYKV